MACRWWEFHVTRGSRSMASLPMEELIWGLLSRSIRWNSGNPMLLAMWLQWNILPRSFDGSRGRTHNGVNWGGGGVIGVDLFQDEFLLRWVFLLMSSFWWHPCHNYVTVGGCLLTFEKFFHEMTRQSFLYECSYSMMSIPISSMMSIPFSSFW